MDLFLFCTFSRLNSYRYKNGGQRVTLPSHLVRFKVRCTDRRRGLLRRRDRATARSQWTVSRTKTALHCSSGLTFCVRTATCNVIGQCGVIVTLPGACCPVCFGKLSNFLGNFQSKINGQLKFSESNCPLLKLVSNSSPKFKIS